ncbi:hypothetical protein [Edaphocola flava]|uniref:hypothetical protein n=1 Tax=Edaphocola flava TaxID=2499629 RepID=UPI00100BB49A|nr:hypothetical protein [Edaphocola flava]
MFYQFREQLKMRGCYAGIVLKTHLNPVKETKLIFNYEGDPQWQTICEAGANIFFDYFKWVAKGELIVDIENIDWMPADSNNLIILYATIEALGKDLDIVIPNLSFHRDSESFIFPECRILTV